MRERDGLHHDLDLGALVDDPPDNWVDPIEDAIDDLLERTGHLEHHDYRWFMASGDVFCCDHPAPVKVGTVLLADIENGRR